MNKKPDEAQLIDYLYGELTGEERAQVENYLQQNPEERLRMETMGMTRKQIKGLPDKEVIAPSFIFGEEATQRPFWKESYFRFSLGIAAAFLVVMISARLIGLDISYKQSELRIGFGEGSQRKNELTLDAQQVAEMIDHRLNKNNDVLLASWQEDKASLEKSINENLAGTSSRIDHLMKVAAVANEKQVKQFVGQLQSDNLKLMKDYMQLSSTGQKEYLENLLVDFSKYLQEQRKEDLKFFQTRMSKVEQNTDQFKQETEQLLTSLITGTNTGNQKRN